MHRTDADSNVNNMFSGGDPLVPRLPTQVDPDWLNAVQEEIVNAILGGGVTLVKGTNNQLASAVLRTAGAQTAAGLKTFTGGAVITQNAETAIPLAGNNVANVSVPRWFKDSCGVVHIQGSSLNSGVIAANTTVATLPAGARPAGTAVFPVVATDTGSGATRAFMITIDTAGACTLRAFDGVSLAVSHSFSWDGISFRP